MPNAEQIKSILQLLLGTGGPLAALIISYGVPAEKLNLWTNLLVAIVPPLVGGIWAILDRTHKQTIGQAATILSAKQDNGQPVGTIVVSTNASDGAAQAVADPNLTNVVPAGSTAAIVAAKAP